MDSEFDPIAARQTLAQLEDRLQRDVSDMRQVLVTDVPTHVVRVVRSTFERSSRADEMGAPAISALKQATQELAENLAGEVGAALEDFEAWTWPSDEAFPADPSGLRDHPRVAEVLDRVEVSIVALLEQHEVPIKDLAGRGAYQIPSYFVAGHFMKSLVANYWRALRDYEELRNKVVEAEHSDVRSARRKRWDSA
ncbi:MAG TPA: hypothetical protein DEA08_21990 [Planctomycetes bacterium]|mgnify:CR=1 FL=1|nr:hypothetical protein [Planctomycetota bacterium]|tara:strand:- start:260 stop:844 length:585 start_codon:yes stop_codon:yes gene_type:complete